MWKSPRIPSRAGGSASTGDVDEIHIYARYSFSILRRSLCDIDFFSLSLCDVFMSAPGGHRPGTAHTDRTFLVHFSGYCAMIMRF